MVNENLKRFLALVVILIAASVTQSSVSGQGVTIELQNIFLGPGGSSSMDVVISPTSGPQTLNSFDVPFLISASSPGQLSSLQFANPHNESFLTDAASDYLFFGNSDAVATMLPVNETSSVITTNDKVSAFDLTFNLMNFNLTTPRLLTRLQFTNIVPPGTGPLDVIGDSFSITVDPVDAFVDNVAGNLINVNIAGPGTVTVVPEPGTFAACAVFTGLAALRRRRRR